MDVSSISQTKATSQTIKILFLIGVVLSCLIILVNQNLPFLDYPNHLARYYLLTRDYQSPLYNQFYANNFRVIPNIGVDVLMAGFGRIIEPSLALRILLIGTIASASLGYAKLSLLRNQGQWHPAVILIPLTLFSFSLILGFLNFVLAASVLPWAIYLYERYPDAKARFVTVGVFSIILFFCHMMVAVLLLVIVGSKLFASPSGRTKWIGLGSIALCMLAMAALFKISSVSGEASTIVFTSLIGKLKFFLSCLAFGPWWSIVNSLTFIGFISLFWLGYANIDREDQVVLIGLLLFYIACPFGFKITANMDGRIPAILFALYLSMSRLKEHSPNRMGQLSVGLFAILLFNLSSVFAIATRGDQEARKMRSILRQVPTGDALFIADISQWRADHRENWFPPYRMQAYYTEIDRPLFISGLFAFPSQQPVILKPQLSKLGYATRQYKQDDSVKYQVATAWNELPKKFQLAKLAGVKRCWVFFVNFGSTGYTGIDLPNTVFQDKTYLLTKVDL